MKVFLPQSTAQEIRVRPRKKEISVTLEIRQESNDSVTEYPLIGVYSNGFLVLSVSHPFIEGEGYEIKVKKNDDELWRGKGYCTSQKPEEFKLNDGILTV